MSEQDAIKWFKTQFGAAVQQACRGTPYSLDMVAAIAMQETYADCWGPLYQTKPVSLVLRLCVGDTLTLPTAPPFPGPEPIWSPRRAASKCSTWRGRRCWK